MGEKEEGEGEGGIGVRHGLGECWYPFMCISQEVSIATLVDVSTFGKLCMSNARVQERRELGPVDEYSGEQPIAMLLIEQVTFHFVSSCHWLHGM